MILGGDCWKVSPMSIYYCNIKFSCKISKVVRSVFINISGNKKKNYEMEMGLGRDQMWSECS